MEIELTHSGRKWIVGVFLVIKKIMMIGYLSIEPASFINWKSRLTNPFKSLNPPIPVHCQLAMVLLLGFLL